MVVTILIICLVIIGIPMYTSVQYCIYIAASVSVYLYCLILWSISQLEIIVSPQHVRGRQSLQAHNLKLGLSVRPLFCLNNSRGPRPRAEMSRQWVGDRGETRPPRKNCPPGQEVSKGCQGTSNLRSHDSSIRPRQNLSVDKGRVHPVEW